MHMYSLIFIILAVLLVLSNALLCSVPDVPEGDVERVIIRNLVCSNLNEDIVRVDPKDHINIWLQIAIELVEQSLQIIVLLFCVLDIF